MSLPRFYCGNISNRCTIEGSEAHHISGVMRLSSGDEVELFDGKGTLAAASIVKAGKREVSFEARDIKTFPPRQDGRIILVVSVAKDQRFDWLIAKATELGVDHICPAMYHRTVKQGSGKNITTRYEKIAVSSAKQCKRLHLPRIEGTRSFAEHLERLGKLSPEAQLVVSSLVDNSQSIFKTSLIESPRDKIVFIGPEGGFTDEEHEMLCERGAIAVRLTETVLRIETAALALASILAIARDGSFKG